ncbi:aminopeptidase N, partial [Arsukibacterium sp.]|uniref:aminopeptidase N n=1 Tax=Arsukibacterium sp. TaxID=1977258 RepID=UPI002FD98390
MSLSSRKTATRLADYQPPSFLISCVDLQFELAPINTRVRARMTLQRQGSEQTLKLDGEQLELISLRLDGKLLQPDDYQHDDTSLRIFKLPEQFELEIVTSISPELNTALEGLYLANGVFCTQCEAEGFRRIMFYLDRPDVLAVFTTTVIADNAAFPYLLANGNKVVEESLNDGRKAVTWHDPFPKPCYLFALVAGDFDLLQDEFITQSGRKVSLQIFVDKGQLSRSHYAMGALKRAMRWDEQRFNLEYDLDIFMLVAVDFFNMGAMENKGLNIFNSKYVLADEQSATDLDFFNIESIIGHEYFHNWTGNRVTCRDWFQLSLKEGLTVFRDQEFSADMASPTLNRIAAVKLIRTAQFAEDASPMAHPIRPEQVLEMNNFYTVTVYDKGAEVIRMLQTLLGKDGFNQGMTLYLHRHDGQAVTCDDFVQAMQDANQLNLSQFKRWYSQSGTPELTVTEHYDTDAQCLTLEIKQYTPATADQTEKLPLMMPVNIELLSCTAQAKTAETKQLCSNRHRLVVTEAEQHFSFEQLSQRPTVVWLEDFSAPVKLIQSGRTLDTWLQIAAQASNDFARWDAMQQFWLQLFTETLQQAKPCQLPSALLSIYRQWLAQPLADLALTAELLTLPDFDTLAEHFQPIDVDAILLVLQQARQLLASSLQQQWLQCYRGLPQQAYQYSAAEVGRRRLRQTCLGYLALTHDGLSLCTSHYHSSDNMTDILAALNAARQAALPGCQPLLSDFADHWQHNVQVMDKYFGLVAMDPTDIVFEQLRVLEQHAHFSWKN